MKYTDTFKRPLTREDVALVTRAIVRTGSASALIIQRHTKIGVMKTTKIIKLLEDAKVLRQATENAPRVVILKNETIAVNAALRQLKKGNK